MDRMDRNVPQTTPKATGALAFAFALTALLTASVSFASSAAAQDFPDVRNVRPSVSLLVDSSGSMERMPDCTCSTTNCSECLPACAAGDKNRWAILLEAFTGTFDTWSCTENDRSGYTGEFDHNYFLPHYEAPVGISTQQNNGVLDSYLERIRFSLMTFDGVSTLSNQASLVPASSWAGGFLTQSDAAAGMYSYGGYKAFNFPGCLTDFALDNGARNETTSAGTIIPGNLVSMGDNASDHLLINANVQNSLLKARPYGPTPIAGMLEDYRFYLNNHPDQVPVAFAGGAGDPYAGCRGHYAVLISDGYPNADMRGLPYQCDTPGYDCPYELPQDITADLCSASGGECTGEIDGMYVVGFNVADPAASAELDAIAAAGGTGSAFYATDRASLVAALSAAFDAAAPGATSRTVPDFASSASVSSASASYQFSTGFVVGDDSIDRPWSGIIERNRFSCSGLTVVQETIDDAENDRFHIVLNNRVTARNLYTVVPTAGNENGWLTNDADGDIPLGRVPGITLGAPTQQGLDIAVLETSNGGGTVPYTALNAADITDADGVLDWVYARGGADADRIANRLGDVYHSSPQVVGAPTLDRSDEAFNLFRRTGNVLARPTVVYVGSNDGILHAFAAESHDVDAVCADSREAATDCDHDAYDSSNEIEAGEELWGFVPPMVLERLKDATTAHQWTVDATPMVKDVYYAREVGATPTATEYHTVLVAGLRNGGSGVFALDVTDPATQASGSSDGDHHFAPPKFLWQFTDANMGPTYGNPAIAQVLVDESGTLVSRAVAIIPGGLGAPTGAATAVLIADQLPDSISGVPSPRLQRRDHNTVGRSLYVVDIATGRLLAEFDSTTLTAPMVGAAAAFPGGVGQIADRAFMTDADGVIWRLDLSDSDPANWSVEAFHDIFHDKGWDAGEPAYNKPIISVDDNGNVVVIQATGDIDILDGISENRVVSLTENLTFDASGAVTTVEGTLNWEIDLVPGEQVTGPLELFDSRVYFGTFVSVTAATDACAFGVSKIWGVDYLVDDGSGGPGPGLESTAGSGVFDLTYVGPFSNQLIMGVAVSQQPNCFSGDVIVDAYLGSRYRVSGQGGGGFDLVAQVGGDVVAGSGGSLANITRSLPVPTSHTDVLGYTGGVD
ncbi:MAG: hypothetical protein JRH11_05045 [Deltaproteobacteria bacterium]|nr:hypothetical protein [Deltaproteobacteria bacterium]